MGTRKKDRATGEPVVPGDSLGFRSGKIGRGRWNLDLGATDPELSLVERAEDTVTVALPRFGVGTTEGGSVMLRGVPVCRIGGRPVTTERTRGRSMIAMGAGTNHVGDGAPQGPTGPFRVPPGSGAPCPAPGTIKRTSGR